MGNLTTSKVKVKGMVGLIFTSRKKLQLNDVLFVPKVKENFISRTMLDRHGFSMTLKSQKVVLAKNGIFVGKGSVKDGLWNLNAIDIKADAMSKDNTKVMNKSGSSVYLLQFYTL